MAMIDMYLGDFYNSESKQVRQQPAGINFSNEIHLILKRRLVSQVKLLARVREALYLRFSLFNSGKITQIRRVLQTVLDVMYLMRSFCCSFFPQKESDKFLIPAFFLSNVLGLPASKQKAQSILQSLRKLFGGAMLTCMTRPLRSIF